MGVMRTENRLLRALPPEDLSRLLPLFERVEVRKGDLLWSVGERVDVTYFPERGVSSNLAIASEGRRIEVGCFGCEGMVSVATALGSDRAAHELLVEVGGPWLRIRADALQGAMRDCPAFHDLILRYAHIHTMTLSQTAMSNGTQSVEERLARWILMVHDRMEGDELPLTHGFLSMMLAVQRSSVTLAIQAIEGYGAIRARRALITVRDRGMLYDLAGRSYGPAEAEYERLIGPFRRSPAPSEP